jgi:prepilin-type N-terminal cleavage/methylation domain-containing protein
MQKAFSLVELSIVLVILGLLTGGILAGQSLIRASELRAVTTEYQRYIMAVQSFRDKYMALPGDMRNATRFWGAQTGATIDGPVPACLALTTAATGTLTCNGNGDGDVGSADGNVTQTERFRFWQHLANAGLIEGTYAGVRGPLGQSDFVPNFNQPASKLGNANWCVAHWNPIPPGDAFNFAIAPLNMMWISADVAGVDAGCDNPSFKPEEVWNIDQKLDDGKPGRGKVITGNWDSCSDASSFSDLDSEYDFMNPNKACWIVFPKAF